MKASAHHAAVNDVLSACGNSTIYTAGIGMIIGSLFTILVLLLLDYMRDRREHNLK